jgi:hypothetical protein
METGTAMMVVDQLDEIVLEGEGGLLAKVILLYPQKIFRGDNLEGIVIRYVPHKVTSTGNDDCVSNRLNSFNKVKELCTVSNKLLRLVLPSAMVDGHMATTSVNLDTNAIRRDDLRALAEQADFKDLFDNVLQSLYGPNYRRVQSSCGLESASPLKNFDVVGGDGSTASDGSITFSSGIGTATSSGCVAVSTSNTGTVGVSGDLSLSNGTVIVGNSSALYIGSGSSASGSGGSIAISVGSGTDIGGVSSVTAGDSSRAAEGDASIISGLSLTSSSGSLTLASGDGNTIK